MRARCSACKAAISPRYPLVEVFTGIVFAAVGWRFGETPVALLWCGMASLLIALAGIDWDTTFLPDNLTLPLLWAGIVSARSGETEDTTIVDLAIGWGVGQLKVGSFARSERMAKWNEALRIEQRLGAAARFAGAAAFGRRR